MIFPIQQHDDDDALGCVYVLKNMYVAILLLFFLFGTFLLFTCLLCINISITSIILLLFFFVNIIFEALIFAQIFMF